MAFDDELAKLQRARTFYLDFSHVNNPGGVDWPDPAARLYGKSPDARGPIPIVGTVESFGLFTQALCNFEFDLEFPSCAITLFDPDNQWRILAGDPARLAYRWLALVLRVLDDTGAVLDRRYALGQVTKPSFPATKRCVLNTQLTGGKWLGEMIPRRTIQLTDFPRAAPENVGKAVPIVFGALSNEVSVPDPFAVASPGCAPRSIILLQESFANGNGVAFATEGNWRTSIDGVDPLYPKLGESEMVQVYEDYLAYGVNALGLHANGNGGAPDYDWVVSGIAFSAMGSLTSQQFSDTGFFDDTEGWWRFTYIPTEETIDPAGLYYCPLITHWRDAGYNWGLQATVTPFNEDGAVPDGHLYIEIMYMLPNGSNGYDEYEEYVQLTDDAASLVDVPQTFVLCHKCGTFTYNGGSSVSVANDGYIKLYLNGRLIYEKTGIPLLIEYGDFVTPGRDNSNLAKFVSFGWYGMIGLLTNIYGTAGAAEVIVKKCEEEPGTSQNMASGALRGLLVDTGTVPAVSGDTVLAGFEPVATPAASTTHEAHNAFGSGTINKAVFFHMAGRNVSNEIGQISAISDLDNDYDPDQEAHAASLSWHTLAGAKDYVVWMSTDPTFHPVTNPAVGSPRTKIVSVADGSTFPPISGPAFDYQVLFTSLQDGTAYTAQDASSESPTGYRYLLAGHTLKSVDQVYVLKPVPTVVEGADQSSVTEDAAVGATQVQVAYVSEVGPVESDVPRFSQGNFVIFAGMEQAYEVIASEEGLLTIDPPLVGDVTAGTAAYKAQTMEQQVLQVEGEDYEQEVIEVNGNRYHTLVFYEAQQSPDDCAQYEVTANVQGSEINADGTGMLINHGVSIFQHLCKNWIFNDYRSSVGPFAPSGSRWFEDVPYAPGLIDNDSFYAANLIASGRVSGSYIGAGALTEQIPASQLIKDLCTSFDLDFYYEAGAWHVKMFDPGYVDRDALSTLAPDTHIIEDTFAVDFEDGKHANVIPYFAGPMLGRSLGASTDQTGGYVISGELADDVSLAKSGRLRREPIIMPWTRHAATAYDVAFRKILQLSEPSIVATFTAPLSALLEGLATEVKVTHPDGLGDTGWVAKVCRLLRADIDMDNMLVNVVVRDIDRLVP